VFATNPWPLINRSIRSRCAGPSRSEALAFAEQAEDYFRAAHSVGTAAAKPVQLYYSFMNLVKAFVLTSGQQQSLDKLYIPQNVRHGLSENIGGQRRELVDAYVDAFPTSAATINLFDEFHTCIIRQPLRQTLKLPIMHLLPQVLPGHRVWASVARSRERFISLESLRFYQDEPNQAIWFRMYVYADDLGRLDVTHQQFLREVGLEGDWHEVVCDETREDRRLLCFEQNSTIRYGHLPSDVVQDLIRTVETKLWATVLLQPPYRKYYVYLAPDAERQFVLPQLLSVYAIMYYLGSITRYRPQHFDRIVDSEYGVFIEEFLSNQPTQFVYLLLSRFAEREVTKAAIL
jgi:hypothetical protein